MDKNSWTCSIIGILIGLVCLSNDMNELSYAAVGLIDTNVADPDRGVLVGSGSVMLEEEKIESVRSKRSNLDPV